MHMAKIYKPKSLIQKAMESLSSYTLIEKEDLTSLEKENLQAIKEGNISLILNTYNDIFSDFDPRPYSERALSDDFLIECRRAARDKAREQGIEIRLLIPKTKRNKSEEAKIKKRLKDHFVKHAHQKHREVRIERRNGGIWFIVGTALIISSALLYPKGGFMSNLLVVMLEPAGWFTVWTGLEKIFINFKEKHPDFDFYQKMSKVEITFNDY